MPPRLKKPRFSSAYSLLIAALIFPVAYLVAAEFVYNVTVGLLGSAATVRVGFARPFDALLVCILIGLPALLAYLLSRVTFFALRWQGADDPSVRACEHCGYNLTGNVSGLCPECGEPAVDETTTSDGRR